MTGVPAPSAITRTAAAVLAVGAFLAGCTNPEPQPEPQTKTPTAAVTLAWGLESEDRLGTARRSSSDTPQPVARTYPGTPTQVVAGSRHTCALIDNKAWCWGRGREGQHGNGEPDPREEHSSAPVPVTTPNGEQPDFTALASGMRQICGLTPEQSVMCWGYGYEGETGNGTTTQWHYHAEPVASSEKFTSVAATTRLSCATTTRDLLCWGSDPADSSFSSPTPKPRPEITQTTGPIDRVWLGVGSYHCVTSKQRQTWCWGEHPTDPDGPATPHPMPTAGLPPGTVPDSLASNPDTICLTSEGKVWCRSTAEWNKHPDTEYAEVQSGGYTEVALGLDFACATGPTSPIVCWGRNTDGQLGNPGPVEGHPEPASVAYAPQDPKSIAAGHAYACAVARTGESQEPRILCWGRGHSGQLGNAARLSTDTPVQTYPQLPTPVQSLSLNDMSGCAVAAQQLHCWGFGLNRGLWFQTGPQSAGGPQPEPFSLPTPNAHPQQVAAGFLHACVLDQNGAAYCMGQNRSGELGIGTTEPGDSYTMLALPSTPEAPHTFTQIDAGQAHTCGVHDSRPYCWGSGEGGATGLGTTENTTRPTELKGSLQGRTVTEIAAGGQGGCAIAEKALHCWGVVADTPIGTEPKAITGWPDIDHVSVNHSLCVLSKGTPWCAGAAAGYKGAKAGTLTNPAKIDTVKNATKLAVGGGHACAAVPTGITCWGEGSVGQLGSGSRLEQAPPTPARLPAGFANTDQLDASLTGTMAVVQTQ